MSRIYDYFFQILILGDFKNKAAIQDFLLRFLDEDRFPANNPAKVWFDFKIKIIDFENKVVKLQIWDGAGEERYRTITKTFYKGVHGIILMYDVTDQNSFKYLRGLVKQIDANADKSVGKVIVGLKSDEHGRVVTEEQGKKMAEDYNMGFFESSARTNKNVSEVFYYLIKEIIMEINLKERKKKEKEEEAFKKKMNIC